VAQWEKRIFALNLVVGDLDRSKAFYREVLGLAPLNEDEDFALFRLTDLFVALRLDPAHDATPSGEILALAHQGIGQFAIVVDDVDAVRAELDEHGVEVISGPADRYWGMRTLTFADPDGYTWGIAEDLPAE
jgi:catechol 2,3-dioxygenase-like lactoylglutathione lyase family enzyme